MIVVSTAKQLERERDRFYGYFMFEFLKTVLVSTVITQLMSIKTDSGGAKMRKAETSYWE